MENIVSGSRIIVSFPGGARKKIWIHHDRVRAEGMIYGKVCGRSIVLARFLIEISSHARHNNFSRTCKHEGRPRVRSIFSTWT